MSVIGACAGGMRFIPKEVECKTVLLRQLHSFWWVALAYLPRTQRPTAYKSQTFEIT